MIIFNIINYTKLLKESVPGTLTIFLRSCNYFVSVPGTVDGTVNAANFFFIFLK